MSEVLESRHGHYLIQIFTFVRRIFHLNLVLPDSALVQVTLEIYSVSLIDKIGHDGTVHSHCLGHVSQFEIGVEVWFLLGHIVFERSPAQLFVCVVWLKVLFGIQTVVTRFLFVDRKQIGGFVREILPADNLVCKQDLLSHHA